MSIDEPQNLVLGLFIRDVAALSSAHSWLPPAAPAVPGVAGGGGSPAAARQWDAWWDHALAVDPHAPWLEVTTSWWGPPDFGSLDAAPQLQALVRSHFGAAVRWSENRNREHIAVMTDPGRGADETRLVADLESACGRRAALFNLRVTEIPFAGRELWQLHPEHVVVTAGRLLRLRRRCCDGDVVNEVLQDTTTAMRVVVAAGLDDVVALRRGEAAP